MQLFIFKITKEILPKSLLKLLVVAKSLYLKLKLNDELGKKYSS